MDGSKRSGPGLPGFGDSQATGKPSRPNLRKVRALSPAGHANDGEITSLCALMGIAIPIAPLHRQRSTSAELRRISRQSRLPVEGRAKARWIHRSESSTSMRSGSCRCWLEKPPEKRSRNYSESLRSGPRCAASGEGAKAKRWSLRASARRNSHCTPTL